jgi:hypothetical protein
MCSIQAEELCLSETDVNKYYRLLMKAKFEGDAAYLEALEDRQQGTRSRSSIMAQSDAFKLACGALLWGVTAFPRPSLSDVDMVDKHFGILNKQRHLMTLHIPDIIDLLNMATPQFSSQDGSIYVRKIVDLRSWRSYATFEVLCKLQVKRIHETVDYLSRLSEMYLCTEKGALVAKFKLSLISTKSGFETEIWHLWDDHDMSHYTF